MIWATVSSWSYFCWLYRVSPSVAAKNIINMFSVLTIWWCSCVESSLVLLEEGVCYDQRVLLQKSVGLCPDSFVLQGQMRLLLQVSLDFLLCIPVPYNGKDIFWRCQFWKVFIEPFYFSFSSITGQGTDMDYYDIEWFALETNIQPFLRLHPSTEIRLCWRMATPFLLRDPCPW